MNQKKKPNMKRSKYLIVYVSEAEHRAWERAAKHQDIPLGELIRRCARMGWAELKAKGGLPGAPLAATDGELSE